MYSKLIKAISNYISLDQHDIDLVHSLFQHKVVEKGSSIIEAGKLVKEAYFINSGYLKYTKALDSGEELVIHLYSSNSFATSLNDFFLGMKSEEELQAITDCDLLYITKSDLDKLYSTSEKWQYFGRRLMEDFLIEKEEKIIDQLSLTAQDRYLKLMKTRPEIIQNVSVKYIASYIGIQPESLSRIKRQNITPTPRKK